MKKRTLEIMQINNNEEVRHLSQMFSNGLETFFYGCGNQGFICEDILVNALEFPVTGFIVSDGQPLKVKWDTELPVYQVADLGERKEEINILFTMGYNTACKIRGMLEELGYKHIYMIQDWEKVNDELREISLKIALEKNGYYLSNEDSFKVNNFHFLNPYQNELTRAMFMRECENIIGERYLNATKAKIDSSYENGRVRLKKEDIVMDCGANIGLFSAFAASLGCQVFAFEPVAHIADITRQVAGLYPEKIEVIQKACSNTNENIKFVQMDEADCFNSDSSHISFDLNASNTVEIPSTTIDSVVEEYRLDRVDFIKADIEGAERYMLMGATNTLRKYAPKLSICTYHLPDDKEVLTSIILETNPEYVIEYKWDKLYAYVPEKISNK